MASVYPGALDSLTTTHIDNVGEPVHNTTINDLADGVNKIEAELGANAYGAAAKRPLRIIDAQREFGVLGDYTTDCTTRLQAALDAAWGASTQNGYYPAAVVQLPPGKIRISATVNIKENTILRGAGRGSTYLVGTTAFHGTYLKNFTGNSGMVEVRDLGFLLWYSDSHAIDFTNSPGTTFGADSAFVLKDLFAYGGGSHYHIAGTEARMLNCISHLAGGVPFNIEGSDHVIDGCTAGGTVCTGSSDFLLSSANVRMSNCKAYGSAQVALTAGGGGRHTITNFEAQDCKGGVSIGAYSIVNGLLVDSCCDGVVGSSALTVNGPMKANGTIIGNRGGGLYTTPCAFNHPAANYTPVTLDFQISTLGNRVWQSGPFSGIAARINGMDSRYVAAYATPYTPDPTLGTTHSMTLTGIITINNPVSNSNVPLAAYPGMKLRFILTQDATGGRTVTWGANYKTSAAIPTTLNTTTSIDFEYDGTNWRETSRATTT